MKNILIILSWLTAGVLITSCFDDPGTEIVWGDQAYLELQDAGKPNPTVSKSFTKDVAPPTPNVPFSSQVNIMGKQSGSAINVTYQIDASSTAVAGVHYKDLSGGTISIPANESSATINFEAIPDNLTTSSVTIVVKLTGGDLPLSKYIQVTYSIKSTN